MSSLPNKSQLESDKNVGKEKDVGEAFQTVHRSRIRTHSELPCGPL